MCIFLLCSCEATVFFFFFSHRFVHTFLPVPVLHANNDAPCASYPNRGHGEPRSKATLCQHVAENCNLKSIQTYVDRPKPRTDKKKKRGNHLTGTALVDFLLGAGDVMCFFLSTLQRISKRSPHAGYIAWSSGKVRRVRFGRARRVSSLGAAPPRRGEEYL